jgi:hypothetical protein
MEKSLRDIVAIGSLDDVRKMLAVQQGKLSLVAEELLSTHGHGVRARFIANICRATVRQLNILQSNLCNPIEAAASACRAIFELHLVSRWALLSESNLDRIVARRAIDEIELIESFLALSSDNGNNQQHARSIIENRKDELGRALKKYVETGNAKEGCLQEMMKSREPKIALMARQVGAEGEYRVFYKFYCKYVHASSWLINADDERRDNDQFRNIFLIKAQFYAGKICGLAHEQAGDA